MSRPAQDLPRIVLAVLFIGGLMAASFWILRPFLGALLWAAMIVVATWPLMIALQKRLWGKRALAVTFMTVALLMVLIVPLAIAVLTIVDNASRIAGWLRMAADFEAPKLPEWVAKLPLAGERIVVLWDQIAADGLTSLLKRLEPYAGKLTTWFVSEMGSVGMLFVQFLLIVVISALMYAYGETAASAAKRFGRRLGGARGIDTVTLGAQAIRGVALGVVVTALVQSILGGIGLAVTGVPFAAVLTAVMFMLCIAQLGPLLVLVPAIGWLYWSGANVAGTVLLVVSLVVGTLDNFLRPYLIKKGADLPLLLILAGVIGGLVAFGLIGIFVGPLVLAVAYKLLGAWMAEEPPGDAPPATQ
jgi:predicted PurR-regulated permease PerM